MLQIITSWFIMYFIFFSIGCFVIQKIYINNKTIQRMDIYLVTGLLIVTFYSNLFSIFYKIGSLSFLLLFIISLILFLSFKEYKYIKNSFNSINVLKIIVFFCALIFSLIYTSTVPNFYDTNLYHFQAIKWIEEYGVVKGLGNIHNRFAYNSAFFPLQALFSFSWLFTNSLHTVNGFICLMFVCISIFRSSLFKKEKLRLSDYIRFCLLFYVVYVRLKLISSPTTDFLPMILICYVFAEWVYSIENSEKESDIYCILSLFLLLAMICKLSTAVSLLLIIYPLYLLEKNKKYKEILIYLFVGVVICAPWIIRNVIISGYLIYPYNQIDLFDFDWKMAASVVEYDRKEICVWGRTLKDVDKYDYTIIEWLPIWFKSQETLIKLLMVCSIISSVVISAVCCIKSVYKKISLENCLIYMTSVLNFAFWLFTAPLPRYGLVYLLITICVLHKGIVFNKIKIPFEKSIICVCLLFVMLLSSKDLYLLTKYPIYQSEYETKETYIIERENFDMYYPKEDDQCGCGVFPCVPYEEQVNRVELIGNNISEGFRLKDKYIEGE